MLLAPLAFVGGVAPCVVLKNSCIHRHVALEVALECGTGVAHVIGQHDSVRTGRCIVGFHSEPMLFDSFG